MTVPAINYLAVILATLSSMVVGTLWYHPKTFGTLWMREAGVTPSGNARDAARPIIVTVIVSFVTAWVLAGATWISFQFYEGSFPRERARDGRDPLDGLHRRALHHPRPVRPPHGDAHRAELRARTRHHRGAGAHHRSLAADLTASELRRALTFRPSA